MNKQELKNLIIQESVQDFAGVRDYLRDVAYLVSKKTWTKKQVKIALDEAFDKAWGNKKFYIAQKIAGIEDRF